MSIQQIQSNPVYQQVLKDSIGGLLYDMGKRGTYDAEEIIKLWDNLGPAERETSGGIMKGAMAYLKGE